MVRRDLSLYVEVKDQGLLVAEWSHTVGMLVSFG